MDNFKCLSTHICEILNKKDTIVSVDLIDGFETLHKELSMKITHKFQKVLKLANLEKRGIDFEIGWMLQKEWIFMKLIFLSRWKDDKFGTKVSWVWS